ncbi:Tc toxin subunit A [Rahnella sp. RcJ3]|uniref:Tc toxin subunit A n=1 Tax=Rahnella sp. RcJ3 TaxID=2292446 RepID=UPI001294ED45|nr:Tc toxin subunit A [Rahnella sp. RcJ3]MQB53822.1 virulence plasmid 28 protein [Rahnella sp. RcJ3]
MSENNAISQLSGILDMNNQLEENGYHSVFDIIRVPRNVFITRHQLDFGQNTEKVYDLAVGYATQLSRLFKKNSFANTTEAAASPALLRGTQNTQGLQTTQLGALEQNIPTYAALFNETWTQYCLTNAPEALDSPVSYLNFLYQQAMDWESAAGSAVNNIFHLSQRRPDLPDLLLDEDAINQVIPTLDIVNDVLEAAIAPSVPQTTTVDKTLSTTRYPNTLPYHYPHQQVLTALEDKPLSLQDILQQADQSWPLFTNDTFSSAAADTAKSLGSNLAPEQQQIVSEAVNASSDAWYQANYGIASAANAVDEMSVIDTFLHKTSLDDAQLESLISGNSGGGKVISSPNTPYIAGQQYYGSKFINKGEGVPVKIDKQTSNQIFTEGSPEYTTSAPIGEGLILDAVDYQLAYIPKDISYVNNTLTDFTLGFWCRISSGAKDWAMIFSNKVENPADISPGITVFLRINASGLPYIYTNISDGVKRIEVAQSGNILFDQWVYICIRQNATQKILTTTIGVINGTPIQYDSVFSTLSSTKASAFLGFNGNKGDKYYISQDARRSEFSYDDICIWDKYLSDENVANIIQSPLPAGGRTDFTEHFPLTSFAPFDINLLKNLNHDRLERINRQIRLQRWLGLPFDQVDLLVSATMHAENNTALTMNNNTLRMLGVFRHYQQYYAVNAWQFSALIDEITPYAISPEVPFFDQIFNSPSLFETPFTLTNANFSYDYFSEQSGRIIKQLCAGLGISEVQFSVLAELVAAQQGSLVNRTLPCSLPVVSALYRLVTLPKLFGLSLPEGLSLMQLMGGQRVVEKLAGVPAIKAVNASSEDILDVLMALSSAVQWLKTSGLSAATSLVLLDIEGAAQPQESATTGQMNLISDTNQHLSTALLTDAVIQMSGVPESEFLLPATIGKGSVFTYMSQDDSKFEPSYLINTEDKEYIYFTDEVMAGLNGEKDYSIGFWLYIPSGDSGVNTTVVMTNCSSQLSPGFTIEFISSELMNFSLFYRDGASNRQSSGFNGYVEDEWLYINYAFNANTKKLQLYCSFADALNMSHGETLSGGLFTPGNHVVMGRYGNLTPFAASSVSHCGYSDIAVWDRVLSLEEIRTIVQENLPATDAKYKIYPESYSSYLYFLNDLIDGNGIILPVICQQDETELDAITRMVTVDIATLDIEGTLTRQQIIAQLANLIYQTKLTQDGIANSAIAKALSIDQSLSPFLLTWANSGSHDFLSQCWGLRDVTDAHDNGVTSWTALLFDVGRRAALTRIFHLSAAAVSTYLSHPDWFGTPDSSLTLPQLYAFSRYDSLSLQTPLSEDELLAYLNWVNSGKAILPEAANQALAALLGWETSETTGAVDYVCSASTPRRAVNLSEIARVMDLQRLSRQTGLSVTFLLSTAMLNTGSAYEQWLQAGESLISTMLTE